MAERLGAPPWARRAQESSPSQARKESLVVTGSANRGVQRRMINMAKHQMEPKPVHSAGVGLSQQVCERCQLEVWIGFPTKQSRDGVRLFWKEIPQAGKLAEIMESIPCDPSWSPSGPDWRAEPPSAVGV